MKAPASISVISSLVLAVFASIGTARSATNEAGLMAGSSTESAPSQVSKETQSLPRPLSRGSRQIVQLTQAGMDESVLVSFIRGSGQFHLSADHIVYLNDLGVSSGIIQAMLAHDREILGELSQTTNVANVSISAQQQTAVATQPAKTATSDSATSNYPVLVEAAKVAVIMPPSMQSDNRDGKEDLLATPKNSRPQVLKRKVLYPVREPYSVELTAPIVFLEPPTF